MERNKAEPKSLGGVWGRAEGGKEILISEEETGGFFKKK